MIQQSHDRYHSWPPCQITVGIGGRQSGTNSGKAVSRDNNKTSVLRGEAVERTRVTGEEEEK